MLHAVYARLHALKLLPQNVPLRAVLIIPFIVQTLAIVGLVSYLSFQSGQQAVAHLASELTTELGDRVRTALTTQLAIPYHINRLNENAVQLGYVDPQTMSTFEPYLMAQINEFDSVVGITFANEQGEMRRVERQPGGVVENAATNVQEDAWYQEATQTQQPSWSSLVQRQDPPMLAINAYHPVYDVTTQQRLGVFSVNFGLDQINSFLETLLPDRFGEVFILERNGLLVADSTGEAPLHSPFSNESIMIESVASKPVTVRQIRSKASTNALIKFTREELQRRFSDLTQITQQQQFVLDTKGSKTSFLNSILPWGHRHYIQVIPLRYTPSLDWLIVLTVPEETFAKEINANTRMTLLLCMSALVGAIAIGIITAECIARPMHHLSSASQAIADGKIEQQIDANTIVYELRVMAESFNQMTTHLQQSFDQIEIALQESEEKFTKIFRCSPNAISITQFESGKFLEVNDSFLENYAYPRDEVIGRTSLELGLWQQKSGRDWFVEQLKQLGRLRNLEFEVCTKSGELKTVLFSAEIIDLEGETCVLAVRQDISDRKKAADQLNASLREKEILLSEIHHRVKNNLQVVSSLLDLQANRVQDSESREILENSCSRVYAMALVHECLYRSQNFAHISLADYAQELASHLLYTYKTHLDIASLEIKIDPKVSISLQQAIPCGLLLNELVTNALKYGFPDHQPGQVYIYLESTHDHQLALTVGNDGDTLPPDFTLGGYHTSMGIRLITTLADQLEGVITIERGDKTLFTVTFPIDSTSV